MSCLFIDLVDRLAARHDCHRAGEGHAANTSRAQDVEERVSRLFFIACDLTVGFRTADLCEHLDVMMAQLWATLLKGEGASGVLSPSSPAALPPHHQKNTATSAIVAASGALVGYMQTHSEEVTMSGRGSAWVAEMGEQWQAYTLQLLNAQPPFPDEVRAAACFSAAQLALLADRNSGNWTVLQKACEALAAGREDGFSATLATELLGQLTSLMVMCKPFPLSGAELKDSEELPTSKSKIQVRKAAGGPSPSSSSPAASANTQAGKRPKLSTQRPSAHGAAPSTTEATSIHSERPCGAIPACFPFPSEDRLENLKATLIDSCITSLGAVSATSVHPTEYATASPPKIPATASCLAEGQHRLVPTALLCQRVLIPLLLQDGSRGLEKYESLVHNLLHTLASRPRIEASTTTSPSSSSSSSASGVLGAAGTGYAVSLCDKNSDEVVLLLAALFDFLFRHPSLEPQHDYRFSPFLWEVLGGAMCRSLTSTEMDAGHRANMQLRVAYLLKRIVHLTKETQSHSSPHGVASPAHEPPQQIEFHPLFRWCAGGGAACGLSKPSRGATASEHGSAAAWDDFFLVLESLSEYGWHIIEPVMARLDALVTQLDSALAASSQQEPTGSIAAATAMRNEVLMVVPNSALHPHWIEMLLLKLILHPNVGVRKVGLRRIWALPMRVLQMLSAEFLFHYAFQSASDPRLCGDIDRVPITASFLDTKAFEGTEVKAVPLVEPLAQEVERFYAALFHLRWPTSSSNVHAAEGRVDAIQRLLDTTLSKPPRFTVCVLARVLLAVAQVFQEHRIDAEPIVLNMGVLSRLHRFMRDSVQENIPFWLDVRVTAILFAALTTFAAATTSPRRCREHSLFWRLYCMCGPLGESGGHSVTSTDACGQYGHVGAAVEERFLHEWLLQFSAQLSRQGQEDRYGEEGSLVKALLDVDGLMPRVEVLLQAAAFSRSGNGVETSVVKETFFLVGTLTRIGSPSAKDQVRAVGMRIASAVTSLERRAYCAASGVLASAACVVEFHHTLGSLACAQLWDVSTQLQSMSAALYSQAVRVLTDCLSQVRGEHVSATQFYVFGSNIDALAGDVPDGASWTLLNTAHFDVLAAAICSLHTIACHSSMSVPAVAEALHLPQHVSQLVSLLQECAQTYRSVAEVPGDVSGSRAAQERLAAVLIVSRNASRLLQSELCGFLEVCSDEEKSPRDSSSNASDATLLGYVDRAKLPASREALLSGTTATRRCLLAGFLPQERVMNYADQLIGLPSHRVPSGAVPSHLTSVPWPTLLGQHGRYLCNSLYVLLLCLDEAGENEKGTEKLQGVTPPVSFGAFVSRVQDFALGQLSECWTINLACVYDVLLWVAATNLPDVVDYLAIAEEMWAHMKEVGARQYTRLAALFFTALHYVMPHHPGYVKETLLRVLAGEGKDAQTADRDVYFAAVTASLQVLHNPTTHWPILVEVLLYAAILFNTNRDEEENEITVAVTEPLLCTWPPALRQFYPPTTRMSAVGRAMAVATLLWCCHIDVAGKALPLTKELLRMSMCHPVVTHEPCMPNSRTHRTRIRLWQLLCALLPCIAGRPSVSPEDVEEIFRMLISHCLTVTNMGSVRRLMELYAIRLVEEHASLYTILAEVLGNYAIRPQVCGSYILIACHALLRQQEPIVREGSGIRNRDEALVQETFTSLFPRILQQSTSNQHLLRIISHIGLVHICRHRLAQGQTLPTSVDALYNYVLNAPEHVKLREKHEHMLFFNTSEASSPRSLFCVQRKEANTVLAEVLPAAAFERLRFVETEMCCMIGASYPMELLRVHDWCANLRVHELLSVFKSFEGIPHTSSPADYYVDYTREATELLTRDSLLDASIGAAAAVSPPGASHHDSDGAVANVQKKVSSWWTSEVYNELHPRALRTQKQSLIVVGSLLENPVNIAGLCRCGEIFAVEAIVVPEKKVFEHPHFVAAARSAELWIPWEEVMPKDLPCYLEGLRRRGYTIVGIEQTAASVSIESFSFPTRCVVVLGAEGQGVPAPLIPLLDVCVEIPQYGLIRSLNVHVTGAITMYEYTRQHLMAPPLTTA